MFKQDTRHKNTATLSNSLQH